MNSFMMWIFLRLTMGTHNMITSGILILMLVTLTSEGSKHQALLPYKETIRVTAVQVEPYMMINPHHSNATGNLRYYGYVVDLVQKISSILGVNYEIKEPTSGTYGYRQKGGYWDGMVGELIRADADIAAAPFYSTVHRARVIDFTDPYMEVTATLLLRKPPKATELRIKSARDLLTQTEIQYGTLDTGVIIRAFRTTNDSVDRMLWRNMERFKPSVFTESNEEGIERVRREKYAYVIPSTIGEYISMRAPCDLVTVDRFLMKRGYSLGVQKGSPYLQEINRALYIMKDIGYLDQLYRKWWVDRSQCNGIKSSKIYSVTSSGSETNMTSFSLSIVVTILSLVTNYQLHSFT